MVLWSCFMKLFHDGWVVICCWKSIINVCRISTVGSKAEDHMVEKESDRPSPKDEHCEFRASAGEDLSSKILGSLEWRTGDGYWLRVRESWVTLLQLQSLIYLHNTWIWMFVIKVELRYLCSVPYLNWAYTCRKPSPPHSTHNLVILKWFCIKCFTLFSCIAVFP